MVAICLPTNRLTRSAYRPAFHVPPSARTALKPVCLQQLAKPTASLYRQKAGAPSYAPARSTVHPQAASTSSCFGQQLQVGSSLRPKAAGSAWIQAGAYRRGNTLVICAALATAEGATDVRRLLHTQIQGEKELVTGQLSNGFRYVLLPNKLPPQRFEAHLEVHAGSVDERVDEQGVAHLVEHVTFLGSKKRENLLGTGARANAYTDFHHTVFHVHSPAVNGITSQPMLPQVLEALEEVAFQPQFASTRIEKERKAVLAEAQMMNTIEYRVDCQLLQYLHEENSLGCRFPIGKTEQVKTWPHETLKGFWERWYFPANVTLYLVGDLDRGADEAVALIDKIFGKLQPAYDTTALPAPAHANGNGNGHVNGNGNGAGHAVVNGVANGAAPSVDVLPPLKQRHAVRPPVKHKFGYGPMASGEQPAEVKIFRHPLLQHFMLSVFCKLPIQSMNVMSHLKQLLMMRIILSVFQFRVNGRYVEVGPSFISIALDISDSGREGCAVSTLTVTSEPCDWRSAVSVAVQEVRRLQRHGLTQGEFDRYKQAILRDSAQLAEQANKIPSVDTLNFVMESLACGHTVMGHRDAHEAMAAVADTVTMDEINALARSMLTFSSDYGHEAEVLAEALQQPEDWAYLGPTRATSIVACIPAYMDASGQSISGAAPAGRGANLGAAGHLDADQIDLAALEQQSAQAEEFEVPEGAVAFNPTPEEIAAALSDMALDVSATTDVELPEHLMSQEEVDALVAERRPAFVPLTGAGTSGELQPGMDTFSNIVQRRLSNGIRINYRYTDNEPMSCLMRVIASGGRAAEKSGTGPDGFGAVTVGTRTLSESGTVGTWAREQVEVFCVANLINCALEADEENVVMDFHFAVGDGGMQAVFELLHLFLEQPRWEATAMDRAKQAFLSNVKSVGKSLERASVDRIMNSMMGSSERCFRDPTPEEIEALTLEGMRKTVMDLLHTGNMEVNIVGDFDVTELEQCCLKYLGTVSPAKSVVPIHHHPINYRTPPFEERHQTWHLKDSDERACAYIAGPAPARWGPFGYFGELQPLRVEDIQPPPSTRAVMTEAARKEADAARRAHPLFASVTLMLLTEIINSRLFTTVRDSLGLTYDVSFEVTMFDRIRTGWFSVHVTSHPDKIYDALNASVAVLRDIADTPMSHRELARARTTLLTRHESDLKDNVYWLGLLTHLQNSHVPHKTVECLRDLTRMYDLATLEDVNYAFQQFKLDDDSIFTCVGTSGKAAPPIPVRMLDDVAYMNSGDDDEEEEEPKPDLPNPVALFTAWMAAAQSSQISNAMKKVQQQPDDLQK